MFESELTETNRKQLLITLIIVILAVFAFYVDPNNQLYSASLTCFTIAGLFNITSVIGIIYWLVKSSNKALEVSFILFVVGVSSFIFGIIGIYLKSIA